MLVCVLLRLCIKLCSSPSVLYLVYVGEPRISGGPVSCSSCQAREVIVISSYFSPWSLYDYFKLIKMGSKIDTYSTYTTYKNG